MPRVLHIATSQNDGGIERYGVQLAAQAARDGIETRFACLPGAIVERLCAAAGVPTVPLAVRNSGDGRAVRLIAARIKEHDIEIVHAHSRRDFLPVLLGTMLARQQASRGHAPVRLLLHAHLVRPLGTPPGLSGRVFARGASRIIAVSEAVRTALQASHHFPPGFVQVLHNGVDLEQFAAAGSARARLWRGDLRREWGIAENALVLAMVGRLDAKGQARVLEALPRLLAVVPTLRVLLVGSEGIPGTHAALQSLVRAGHLEECVLFTGASEDIPRVLAASDALAHLPADESFGLALAEAMAAGLPTVASTAGGCREVVRDGETGLLVSCGDRDALSAALRHLLAGDDGAQRRAIMGAAGRVRAEQEFSLSRQAHRLEEIYAELCPTRFPEPAPLHSRLSPS